jgi:hypothetical protein
MKEAAPPEASTPFAPQAQSIIACHSPSDSSNTTEAPQDVVLKSSGDGGVGDGTGVGGASGEFGHSRA